MGSLTSNQILRLLLPLSVLTYKDSGVILNTDSAAHQLYSSEAKGCLLDKTEFVEFLLLLLFPGWVCGRWRVQLQSEPLCEDAGARHTAVEHLFWKSCSTTEESASVEMSPMSRSSQAILRSTRRMILPAHREGHRWWLCLFVWCDRTVKEGSESGSFYKSVKVIFVFGALSRAKSKPASIFCQFGYFTRSGLGESWSLLDEVWCCDGTDLLPYCEHQKQIASESSSAEIVLKIFNKGNQVFIIYIYLRSRIRFFGLLVCLNLLLFLNSKKDIRISLEMFSVTTVFQVNPE